VIGCLQFLQTNNVTSLNYSSSEKKIEYQCVNNGHLHLKSKLTKLTI